MFISLSSKMTLTLLCLEIKILSSTRHEDPISHIAPMMKLGWQYMVTTSLSLINRLFLSFNTNQKPCKESPKSEDLQNKNYIGHSPDPFPFCSNVKEEKWYGYVRLSQIATLASFLIDSYSYRCNVVVRIQLDIQPSPHENIQHQLQYSYLVAIAIYYYSYIANILIYI